MMSYFALIARCPRFTHVSVTHLVTLARTRQHGGVEALQSGTCVGGPQGKLPQGAAECTSRSSTCTSRPVVFMYPGVNLTRVGLAGSGRLEFDVRLKITVAGPVVFCET